MTWIAGQKIALKDSGLSELSLETIAKLVGRKEGEVAS